MTTSLILMQLVVPSVLILAHVLLPAASRIGLVLRAAVVLGLLGYLSIVGVWLFPPWWTPWALAVLLLLLTVWRWRRTGPGGRRVWRQVEAGIALLALAGVFALIAPILSVRVPDDVAIDLAMPLGPGRYLVASGGGHPAINNHLMTLAPGFEESRGQSYGVDIVAINAFGFRADGIGPEAPGRYLITGTPILAPCGGTVIAAVDGLPDNPVPRMDRPNLAGNHVLLDCDGLVVLLAHMKEGSVAVATGDSVTVSQVLGQVGNSGNSSEPHLHIHVQTPAGAGASTLSGDPRWFSIEGAFLLRGQRLVVRE